MTAPTVVITADDLHKTFRASDGSQLEILRGVNLALTAGECVAIVGKSGSGKSTLLNQLGLLDVPTSGEIRLLGQPVSAMPDRQRARLRGETLGFIFQQFHLLDRRTALENVAEPLLYASGPAMSARHTRAAELLDRVGLHDRAQAMPHQLSGGEQQRVAIARALVRQPRVVFADEPTGSLDVDTGEVVLSLLLDLARSSGVTLVLVTHDPDIARRADRMLTLAQGRITEAAS